ncbi:MAG TPA: hypothetical protein VF173_16850 [Thermoanaerobaculia bacterium]|nr:hypothetical protein [Thermoanaerobaculia bacterium]
MSHLHLSFCYYNSFQETDFLYYQGLAEVLNAYVTQKEADGALKPKKIEIEIACIPAINAGPIVAVSQSRESYDVTVAQTRKPDLRQLVRILSYFGSKRWRSFCCYDWGKNDTASRSFDRILDREVGEPDMSFFDGRQQVVFQRDELRVIYEADHLFYELAGQRLDLPPADPVPVKIGDRYLLGSEGTIVVYEKGTEVQRKSIPCQPEMPISTRVYARWVNVDAFCNRKMLSYSYERNRFYDVKIPPGGRVP